jgi:hypothetical protein
MLDNYFQRDHAEKIFFIRKTGKETLIVQIYVDDIMFRDNSFSHEFANKMKFEFEMSIIGELNFFLGIQVKQYDNEIFIFQSKYARYIVKKFGMEGKSQCSKPHKHFCQDQFKPNIDSTLYRSMIGS